MKKVDFRKIEIEGIDGKPFEADISKDIGNGLYYGSRDIKMSELGKRIYHEGEVELDEHEEKAVMDYAQRYPAVTLRGIEKAMKA